MIALRHMPHKNKTNKLFSIIKKYPVLSFFVLAYLGSWIGWSPWWLSESGIGVLPYELPFNAIAGINQIGMFAGPFAAAFLITRIVEGRDGLKKFQKRIFQWRASPLAYLIAFIFIPASIILGYFLMQAAAIAPEIGIVTIGTLFTTYLTYLVGGPLQEEPGWRGFALPRLQKQMHPIGAALLLGVVHCFWHTPLFFTEEWDTARQDPSQLVAYLVLVVSLSFVMSWVANRARGSILLPIFAHNGVNWALFTVATLSGSAVVTDWPAAIGMTVLALVAVVFTRGRLGYNRNSN